MDDQLISDIAFALAHRCPALRLPGRQTDDQRYRQIAKAVVKQLRLSNWRWERGEPCRDGRVPYDV